MEESKTDILKSSEWSNSRKGAWAARGFDFQHMVTVLILTRQWAGLYPSGNCIPEGLDDCVFELADRELWIQIKSRKSGVFSLSEVNGFIDKLRVKAMATGASEDLSKLVILEHECNGLKNFEIEDLFVSEDGSVFICENPELDAAKIIEKHLNVADIIVEGILNDLYRLVAAVATKNAALPFEKRRKITSSEVERKIMLRLEAEDPILIDEALKTGVLDVVDFSTEIIDQDFYRGVKSKLGHVLSGQVFPRSGETDLVIKILREARQILLIGPSGAGKSGLLWLISSEMSSWGRWFEIKSTASVSDAFLIVRFVRSRQPKAGSPIMLAMDEVSTHNCELWSMLSEQLRAFSDVYLVGTARIEDLPLIPSRSAFKTFSVMLDERLAQSLWETLSASNMTSWSHWREPFEKCDGLLLEYTHILTQGGRLSSVIGDQIRQREQEDRHDELSIIRICSAVCVNGGEVSVSKLFRGLNIPCDRGKAALTRLLDEHLVRESREGVIGGLHQIRSQALRDASHDEVVYLEADSLLKAIGSITNESLPRVIQFSLACCNEEFEKKIIEGLSVVLGSSTDSKTWISVLSGLGLATLERNVSRFVLILQDVELDRSFWTLASMFNDIETEVPDIPNQENFSKLTHVVSKFRSLSMPDLRDACLKLMPDDVVWPESKSIKDTNEMLASLLPITGCNSLDSERIRLRYELCESNEQPIFEIARLLSTAQLVSREIAMEMLELLGGEEKLFSIFYSQTAWVQKPIIEVSEDGQRIVRSNWYVISEEYQPDPHRAICDICEVLIGISPESQFSASDAINVNGETIAINDFVPWTKKMPRSSNPAKSRVAWNVVFGELVKLRANSTSLTEYTETMASCVKSAQKILLKITETWIRGKKVICSEAEIEEINETLRVIRSISYADSVSTPTTLSAPESNRSFEVKLGPFLSSVLDNLLVRVVKASNGEGAKATATFAGQLHGEALLFLESEIWRVTEEPPIRELKELVSRLQAVSYVLHELDYDVSPQSLKALIKLAKKAPSGRGIYAAAKCCKTRAKKRLKLKIKKTQLKLSKLGWASDCQTRSIEKNNGVYWPASEIAFFIEIPNSLSEEKDWMECLPICNESIAGLWRFSIAPMMNQKVVSALAVTPSSGATGFLPVIDFNTTWKDLSAFEFSETEKSITFEAIISSCVQISSIIACRNIENLHVEEEEVLHQLSHSLEQNTEKLVDFFESGALGECPDALSFARITRESLLAELGEQTVEARLADLFSDNSSKWHQRYLQCKSELMIAECF